MPLRRREHWSWCSTCFAPLRLNINTNGGMKMTSASSDKAQVHLTGPPQTMLDMVYARLLDAESAQPVLGDAWAKELMDRVDYGAARSPIAKQRRRQTMSIAVRGAQLDIWTKQFLASHERPIVLQIG